MVKKTKQKEDWLLRWEFPWTFMFIALGIIILSTFPLWGIVATGLVILTFWGIAGAETRDARDDMWNFAKNKDDTTSDE